MKDYCNHIPHSQPHTTKHASNKHEAPSHHPTHQTVQGEKRKEGERSVGWSERRRKGKEISYNYERGEQGKGNLIEMGEWRSD